MIHPKRLRDSLLLRLWWRKVRWQVERRGRSPSNAADEGPILLLAGLFPPIVSGGVYRATAFVEHAARRGVEFRIVAGTPYEPVCEAGLRLAARVPARFRVLRARPPQLRPDPRLVPEIDGTLAGALAAFEAGARLCRDARPRAVVAMGPPFHSFLAGAWLSRRFERPLVLDYGDEWSQSPFDFVRLGNSDRGWEDFCLRAADAVVFTTAAQLERQLAVFPCLRRERCHVADNPWEPGLRVTPEAARDSQALTRVGFFGRLANHALPGPFLADLERLLAVEPSRAERLRVAFVGQKNLPATRQLRGFSHPHVLDLVELLPQAEAARRMQACTGLLLLTNEGLARYRPGKLTEYLAAERPILAHGTELGESPDLVRELDAGFVVPNGDVLALASAFDRLATRPRSQRIREWLRTRTGPCFADRMLAICAAAPVYDRRPASPRGRSASHGASAEGVGAGVTARADT